MQHFIAMSGSHGCLPDHCEVFPTFDAAVADLVSLFELGSVRERRLRSNRYLGLVPSPIEKRQGVYFGAEYCEIDGCDCDTPNVHSDSGYDGDGAGTGADHPDQK